MICLGRLSGALAGIESIENIAKMPMLKEIGLDLTVAEVTASSFNIGSILLGMMCEHARKLCIGWQVVLAQIF
jgi:hypothetical protein